VLKRTLQTAEATAQARGETLPREGHGPQAALMELKLVQSKLEIENPPSTTTVIAQTF